MKPCLSAWLPRYVYARGSIHKLLAVLFVFILTGSVVLADDLLVPSPDQSFRIIFSSSMFSEVNESDARASMKVWILTIAKSRGIPVDPDLHIFPSLDLMAEYCQQMKVDGVGLTTPEFEFLRQRMAFGLFVAAENNGDTSEEYLLVVRRASGWTRLEQLEGRTLNVLYNPRMSMAEIWLDLELGKLNKPRLPNFFGNIAVKSKVSQATLPVFFGQVDACLITKIDFQLMSELNPQIREQMLIIASSPPVVPSGLVIRQPYVSPFRTQFFDEIEKLDSSPAGRQILTLTQTQRFRLYPLSLLDKTLSLIAEHRKMYGDSLVGTAGWVPGISK